MKNLRLIILVIAVLTVISGLVQMIRPGFVLDFIGGENTPSTCHFFGIIGMFMLLFGGLVVHTLYEARTSRTAILWAALQKFGAAFAVGLGIYHGLFSLTAGAVAGFDFVSGILCFMYLKSLKE